MDGSDEEGAKYMKVELIPLEGVIINGNKITFGMPINQVQGIGKPKIIKNYTIIRGVFIVQGHVFQVFL